jgi:hypothetical protein
VLSFTTALLLVGCSAEPPAAAPPPAAQAPVIAKPAAPTTPREHGLSLRFYFVGEPMEKILPLMSGQTPNVSEVLPVLDLMSDKDERAEGMQYTFVTVVDGFLVVDQPGKYTLRLACDDGGTLALDGKPLIDHDGLHPMTPKDAEVELAAGEHALSIHHFQAYGGWGLQLSWKRPGASEFEVVPTTALACQAGEVRVTSPGPKKVIRPLDPRSRRQIARARVGLLVAFVALVAIILLQSDPPSLTSAGDGLLGLAVWGWIPPAAALVMWRHQSGRVNPVGVLGMFVVLLAMVFVPLIGIGALGLGLSAIAFLLSGDIPLALLIVGFALIGGGIGCVVGEKGAVKWINRTPVQPPTWWLRRRGLITAAGSSVSSSKDDSDEWRNL